MAILADVNVTEITEFVRESNRIEGIHREPTGREVSQHLAFIALDRITVDDLCMLVSVLQPDAELREHPTMNVRVGRYLPPRGGPHIRASLQTLLQSVNERIRTPFAMHVEYEKLHPFMDGNGRSGRAVWLWMMQGKAPLGFLHSFYYQTLDAQQR